jgi:hypothetical protein
MTTDSYSKCAKDAQEIIDFAMAKRRGNPRGAVIWLMACAEALLQDDKAGRAEASCMMRDLADALEHASIGERA